jgi:hypothetical protein
MYSVFNVCCSRKAIRLLHALQLLMLFVRALTYMESKLFLLIYFIITISELLKN